MKKRAIALLLPAALMAVLLAGCSEEELHYSPGYWGDNVYYSAFVDLRFTLPESWEAAAQEELDAMSAEADKLLDQQRGGDGSDPASGSGVLILVQSYNGIANDYIDGLAQGVELEGANYTVGDTTTVQLAGHPYLLVPLTMEEQDTPYQRQYLRKQGDYLINIMLFSFQEGSDAFAALESHFSEMDDPS